MKKLDYLIFYFLILVLSFIISRENWSFVLYLVYLI